MPNISYVDGVYCNHQNSKVNINDRGYHFGDSVYEVVLFNKGIFYDFEGHINRLFDSLNSINIKFSLSKISLKIIIKNLIKINRVSFGSVYIQVSRGVAERNHSYEGMLIKPLLSIIVTKKLNNIYSEAIGVKAITLNDNRWSRPDIKTTQLLPNVLAKTEANKKGAFEGIFIDSEGYVTEGSSSNIWIVNENNEIVTRALDGQILSGITRKTIAQFAKLKNLTVKEEKFKKEELYKSNEVFFN
ncbi:aminotransferase class IV [Alphaproteobacteria bacterium]|nr:aminotransferase class IV [Alphaproteobacteria bacterium]